MNVSSPDVDDLTRPFLADSSDARLAERAIAVVRALLAMTAYVVVRFDPPIAHAGDLLDATLLGYVVFSILFLGGLLRLKSIARFVPPIVHAIDIGFATMLTLLSEGPSNALFTFLLYPLLAAGYRWGFLEVLITAAVVDVLLAVESIYVVAGGFGLNGFVLRAVYIAAMAAAVGYLAENEKRRRQQARNVSFVLSQVRVGGKLSDSVRMVLNSLKRVFKAADVFVVVEERASARLWLWSLERERHDVLRPELMSLEQRGDYLFEAPGVAWHAALNLLSGNRYRFAAVSVDALGSSLKTVDINIPTGFLELHPCRRLIGVSVDLGSEWTGRVFIVNPSVNVHREQIVRLAWQVVNQVSPAMYGQYLVRQLRSRAEALERARISRELHDGITQSLLGLEMELVVLHRRLVSRLPDATDFASELLRLHRIVRDEVIAVRELMEGVRVGDVESGDFVKHLRDVVDRFSRYNAGIAARFTSDGEEVALPAKVRRHVARILHEALVNVRRHGHATHATVRAEMRGGWWTLTIEDDGRGFPFAGRRMLEEVEVAGQGPRTIAERVRLIEGTLVVESRPGFGARIEVGVPLRELRRESAVANDRAATGETARIV